MLLLEIWLDIVPYLSLGELLRLMQLSKSLRTLTDSHRVWTTLCRKHDLPIQSKSVDKKKLVLDYIRSRQSLLHGTDNATPWSKHGMGAVHLQKTFQDRIVSGGWDGEIKLHTSDGYLLSNRIATGAKNIEALSAHPSLDTVVFSTRHSNSIILQPLTGSLKLEIQLGDCVKSVTHSNDWIVAATESRLRIYSAVSMMELETIPCSDIRYMSILESRILTISGLGLIVAWDLKRSNGILCTGEIPPGVVCCCTAQIEDSIRIYCGFKKGIVRIYKWKEECIIELGDMSTGSDEWISCLTYLSDSRLLAAGSWDSRIYLFDDTGNCQRTVQESSAPLSLLSHNSNSFLCGSYDGSITLHTFSLPSVSRPTTSATDEWP